MKFSHGNCCSGHVRGWSRREPVADMVARRSGVSLVPSAFGQDGSKADYYLF